LANRRTHSRRRHPRKHPPLLGGHEIPTGHRTIGFRTPGGFSDGLSAAPDRRRILLDLGFTCASAKYPRTASIKAETEPDAAAFESIVKSQADAQPFRYPDGLLEIPMSPVSDIGAFRTGRWKLDAFLTAIRLGVEWAIEHRAVYDFLSHPSCLGVIDPDFRAVDLILDLVSKNPAAAELRTLDQIDIAAGVP